MKRWVLVAEILIISWEFFIARTFAEEERRNCFGWVWCIKEKEGETSTDVLFPFFSSWQKGSYSGLALRPFYSQEADPEKEYFRKSILWPLGTYEQRGNMVRSHIVPFFWYGRGPGQHYTVIPPLYLDYERGDRSYFHIFFLYGHHTQGDFYDRHFILGPVVITTHDTRKDLDRWDLLFPLIGRLREKDRGATWVQPFYLSGYDHQAELSFRYVLPFYGERDSPELRHRFFFPLYGAEDRKDVREQRLSLIGLPPVSAFKPFPTLALFERMSTPDWISDRLFPVFRYARWLREDIWEFDALLLFRHHSSSRQVIDRLFPIYGYEHEKDTHTLRVSLLGHRQASFFWYHSNPNAAQNHLFPFWDYHRHGTERSLSMGGVSELSLFRLLQTPTGTSHHLFPLYGYKGLDPLGYRFSMFGFPPTGSRITLSLYEHVKTPELMTNRFFPVYSYSHNLKTGDLRWDAVLLYRHQETATYAKDAFLPLHHYENDSASGTWRFSLFGVPPLTLFQHRVTPQKTDDRLFPLYDFQAGEESRSISVIGLFELSLFRLLQTPTGTSHHLFPLYGYKKVKRGKRISAVGLPPIGDSPALALYEHTETASATTDRVYPVYLYTYDRVKDELFINALLVYQHLSSRNTTKHGIFPLYDYHRHGTGHTLKWRLGIIGIPPLSLYQHLRTSEQTTGRFFPLFTYSFNRITRERRFSLLWPLADYKSRGGNMREFSSLWWLVKYERRDETNKEFWILGGSTLALLRRKVTLERSIFEFNPILPAFFYEADKGKVTELNLLGFGVCTRKGQKKVMIVWIC